MNKTDEKASCAFWWRADQQTHLDLFGKAISTEDCELWNKVGCP